jgi:cytochrome c peroxidase
MRVTWGPGGNPSRYGSGSRAPQPEDRAVGIEHAENENHSQKAPTMFASRSRRTDIRFASFGLTFVILVALASACGGPDLPAAGTEVTVEELGEELFFDPNLSAGRSQSCATCHDPERAFIDSRTDEQGRIVATSLGDDGVSVGDRNAPTAAYAAFAPEFHIGTRRRFNKQNANRLYEGPLGGLFLDGREADLEGQAGGPPLNPLEMGMPDRESVVARLEENPRYVATFRELFGSEMFENVDSTYRAMTEAIAAFERTDVFAPFDSRYDRHLRGEVELSFMELSGKSLFFSEFTNCGICHQLHGNGDPVNKFVETFSGYEYHNVGVPANDALNARTGITAPDLGLFRNPQIDDEAHKGKFRVPTLRNVAVTAPYMHNGVFRKLRTTIEFYDHFLAPEKRPDNPETGEPWRPAEVPETVATDLLEVGDPLTDFEVDALVCFLRALTDQRYEHLIEEEGIVCRD